MQKLIEFTLCGSYSKNYDPYAATEDVSTQRILLAINQQPLSLPEISAKTSLEKHEVLQRLKALERCQLVKVSAKAEDLYYQPNFTIFMLKDQEKLQPLIKKLSESMVDVVKGFLPKIKMEMRNIKCIKAGHVFPDLEYIIVGAYAFDYVGLEFLQEEGLLISKEMPGGNYIFTGLERGALNLRESWMWGHSCKYGKYIFNTHGKLPPTSWRKAFPDLGYVWTYYAEDKEERKAIEQKIVCYGDLLYEILKGHRSLDKLATALGRRKHEVVIDLTFLEELEYVVSVIKHDKREYVLNRPVLFFSDYKRIHKLSKTILTQFFNNTLKAYYNELESSYNETSPAKNGIDLREAFNPIYHRVFEKALDELIASKVICAPPLRRDGQYSAWVAIETKQ
ncbi:MAG: winged helix-turn-helix domain-containing protein [Candidatus Bathyarchaeia archaeon]